MSETTTREPQVLSPLEDEPAVENQLEGEEAPGRRCR